MALNTGEIILSGTIGTDYPMILIHESGADSIKFLNDTVVNNAKGTVIGTAYVSNNNKIELSPLGNTEPKQKELIPILYKNMQTDVNWLSTDPNGKIIIDENGTTREIGPSG